MRSSAWQGDLDVQWRRGTVHAAWRGWGTLWSGTRDAALLGIAGGVALFLGSAHTAAAQSIHKCRNADGRITYSSAACPIDGTPVSVLRSNGSHEAPSGSPGEGRPSSQTGAPGSMASAALPDAAASPPLVRAPLPRQCDNGIALQTVGALLASSATADDTRAFLASERFRLVRCEFSRFTAAERRERDTAMRELDAKDAARRSQAMQRIDAVYDRYLTPGERLARARGMAR